MMRLFQPRLALDLALLSALELALLFFAFNHLVCASGCLPGAPALTQATVFTLTLGLSGIVVGLYRPTLYLQSGHLPLIRLAMAASVASLCGFVAILGIARALGWETGFLLGDAAPEVAGRTGERLRPALILVSLIALLITTRLTMGIAMRNNLLRRRIVVIGTRADARRIEAALQSDGRLLYCVTVVMPSSGASPSPLPGRVWCIVTASTTCKQTRSIQTPRLDKRAVLQMTETAFLEQHLRQVDIDRLPHDWPESAALHAASLPAQVVLQRAFDITTSLALLILTCPVMAVTALAIHLEGPGPLLYRQTRIGLRGRHFTLFKFRSMRLDAEAGGPIWATRHDRRTTRVGSLLRRSRIDELPQLINVLRGEMSMIGPRPERPYFVARLAAHIPHYSARALVKPGITGWAQVNLPYGASVEDARRKLAYDLYYIKHRGVMLDLLILLATIRVVLFQEGAR